MVDNGSFFSMENIILEFLSLKEAAQARLCLHLSKCHIVGNHMWRLILNITFSELFIHTHIVNHQHQNKNNINKIHRAWNT